MLHSLAKNETSQKYQLIIDMICRVQCGFVGGSTVKLKEKARQMTLKFNKEVVRPSFDHYKLPVLHRKKTYTPST